MPSGVYKRTKPAWNKGLKRTEEQKAKQKATLIQKYGVDNICKIPEVKAKLDAYHKSQEFKDQVKRTKQLRYGDPNYNNMDQNRITKQLRYGDYKYNNPDQNTATKRINHTFNTSKIEQDVLHYLIKKYGEDDVIKEYKDSRYPFNCDFYIKSKDLFIELNIHPCHNFKQFNNINDEEELEMLKSKAQTSDYYKNIIKVWTISDPIKFEYANKNKLNYKVYYKTLDIRNDMQNNKL